MRLKTKPIVAFRAKFLLDCEESLTFCANYVFGPMVHAEPICIQ